MRVFYLLAICCLASMTAFAQTTNWTGTANQSWTNPANWSNGTPVSGGTAFIPATATNWPHATGLLSINFLLQNSGQLFFDGTAENFNNIQNFPGGIITVNGTVNHRGPNAFDNNGQVINKGTFTNYGPLNTAGTGVFENRAGAFFVNKDGANLSVYGSFLNDGNFTNDGFATISGILTSTGTITNNKTLSVAPGGQLLGKPSSNFFNATTTAFFEIKGYSSNEGYLQNLGGVRVAAGGKLSTSGVFDNKSVVNNAGELLNYGTYNNGCATCAEVVTTWNEAGGSFTNFLTVYNFATLEILQCSKFYQKSANLAPITGKVWIMGFVYEILGTIDQTSVMGGIVLHAENEAPKPMAMCKPASVTLDASGNATITPAMVDMMSTWDYCTGGGLTVTPATVNCSNVGTVQVTLTARDYNGLTSSCTTTVTVNASAACGNTSCITTANRTVTNNLVTNSGTNCAAGQAYGIWLNGLVPGKSSYYQIQNGVFDEKADGTARLTGLAVNNGDANVKFGIDITFTGRTFSAPPGSPKTAGCYTINPSNWYYYTTTTGTLTGQGSQVGGVVKITRNGPSFQVGTGANLNEATQFGASGWYLTQIVSKPAGVCYASNGGDLNFRLSGTPLFNCTQTDIDVTKCYKIINKYNGQALQLSALTCADGTALQTNTSGTGAGQVFGFTKNADGTYVITVRTSGDVLDISGGSTSDGAALLQWPAHGGANQSFTVQPVSGGYLKFIAKHSGKALALQNCNTSTGNPVVQTGWAETCENAKWQLVETACVTVNCQQYTCNKNILFVVGNSCSLGCGDAAIKNKLTGKGFAVTVKYDNAVTAADATGKGLVLISSTSNSTTIGTKFSSIAVPIITWEPQLYDDLDMCATTFGTRNTCGSNDIKVLSSHAITNGLSGNIDINCYSEDMAYGVPFSAANSLCNFYGDASKSAVICYEKGQNLCNGKFAAEKRIGFCAYDNSSSSFTSNGWKLFLNAVYWATNCQQASCATANPDKFVFNAYKSAFDVQVKWIDRNAADVVKYAVERSTDGTNWGEITSFDSDRETEYFSEMDKNPAAGDNFYRLRMTQLDGTDLLSEEQLVHFANLEAFTAFPNPATEETFLDLRELAGRPATVRFINSMGKLAKTIDFDQIGTEPVRLSTADLRNGLWLLQVESEGLRPVTVKLMVSHLD